jgi:D-lyxose ketol-isomerase
MEYSLSTGTNFAAASATAAAANIVKVYRNGVLQSDAVAWGQHTTAVPTQFYNNGEFSQDAAKQAYFTLMNAACFPISDFVRQNLWVADFSLGRFNEVGLGGVFWTNEKKWNYASIEIFLLPNQMIPEHWHVAIESVGVSPKMESWVVRYGTSFTYGEGEPTTDLKANIHPHEAQHISVKNETVLNVGQTTGLTKPLEKHWMQAGQQGAIVTEVSTYHTGDAVKFTNPKIKF